MRDAMGGTVVLVIIVAFIVIVLAYLAFNVNYTKAFRMKDKIISVYDDYNGNCDGAGVSGAKTCHTEIQDYADKIGYYNRNLSCPNGFNISSTGLYCYKRNDLSSTGDKDALSDKKELYYTIVTKINLDIPIINNILNLKFFYISGETKIYSR